MAIPRDPAFDSTIAFFREGYDFFGRRCRTLGSDIFMTRLMLRRVVCMMGEEAARHFYDGQSFTRVGAMPQTVLRLLQDKGSVQMLDGTAHRKRKQLFLDMTTPAEAKRLGDCFERHWHAALPAWRAQGRIVLQEKVVDLLSAAACDWVGIPLTISRRPLLTGALAAMVDGAGAVGPRNWRALVLRLRAEHWMRRLVEEVRQGLHGHGLHGRELDDHEPHGAAGSPTPLDRIAAFHDLQGQPLDTKSAAVELLNLLRPTVAVAWFITFAALALHEHEEWAAKLRQDPDGAMGTAFAQEVRRFYPFFPVIGGRVRQAFEFRGHHFAKGSWVLLGLHATNHDPRLWPDPDHFRPERFIGWRSSGYDLIPQGAGDHLQDHRCPGESLTVELLRRALKALAALSYDVPEQDLTIPMARYPTLPRSGMIIALH